MALDREQVQSWLDAYLAAWKSYDREQIAALYRDDASCRYHPYDEPIIGRDAIVESWFGAGESAPSRDREGTYDGAYITAAIEGDLAVVTGTSVYSREPGGPIEETFDNCWLIRFDDEGRCQEFTEWYVKRP
jgi:ketosteroid isomerase-like protein